MKEITENKQTKKIVIEEVGGQLYVVSVPKDPVQALRGLAKGLFKKSSTQLIREERKDW